MHLRPSELESVAAGLGQFDAGDPPAFFEALRNLQANDRAPAWELAIRRFGRRKDLAQAAGEIGMDLAHARDLLESLFGFTVPSPPTTAP